MKRKIFATAMGAALLAGLGYVARAQEGGIPNSLPGNEKFTLTASRPFKYPLIGIGLADFAAIEITCNNGQKWKLVCLPDGSKCNVSVDEYVHGLTQWNVGEHCNGARGNAN
jgi:hypothetical protein